MSKVALKNSELPKLAGRVSNRVYLLIGRYYLWGFLDKPLEQITDEEFLSIKWLGTKTVEEIRKVIPAPGKG